MDGILLVDKPSGLSSFDVIRRLRKILPAAKLGHAGTLDPLATGLLIILLGKACKQADRFLKLDKVYEAEITLGATSTTDDGEGTIVESKKTKVIKPNKAEIEKVFGEFTGEISQVPPQYSAIKVAGQRSYKSARQGQAVAHKPRPVTIYQLQITSYKYPKLQMSVSVSSGTYIRSLARDIGASLGTGAYLSSLRRTRIGNYWLQKSIQLEGLDEKTIKMNIIDVQT